MHSRVVSLVFSLSLLFLLAAPGIFSPFWNFLILFFSLLVRERKWENDDDDNVPHSPPTPTLPRLPALFHRYSLALRIPFLMDRSMDDASLPFLPRRRCSSFFHFLPNAVMRFLMGSLRPFFRSSVRTPESFIYYWPGKAKKISDFFF